MSLKLMVDMSTEVSGNIELNESSGEKTYVISGNFSTPDKKNKNGRIYSKAIWESNVANYQKEIQGNTNNTLMELEHPPRTQVNPWEAVAKIRKLEMSEGVVYGEAIILNNNDKKTNQLKALIDAGIKIGVSTRGTGKMKGDIVEAYNLITVDIVSNPSNFESNLEGFNESMILEGVDIEINEKGQYICTPEGCKTIGEAGESSEAGITEISQTKKENYQSVIYDTRTNEQIGKVFASSKNAHKARDKMTDKEYLKVASYLFFIDNIRENTENDIYESSKIKIGNIYSMKSTNFLLKVEEIKDAFGSKFVYYSSLDAKTKKQVSAGLAGMDIKDFQSGIKEEIIAEASANVISSLAKKYKSTSNKKIPKLDATTYYFTYEDDAINFYNSLISKGIKAEQMGANTFTTVFNESLESSKTPKTRDIMLEVLNNIANKVEIEAQKKADKELHEKFDNYMGESTEKQKWTKLYKAEKAGKIIQSFDFENGEWVDFSGKLYQNIGKDGFDQEGRGADDFRISEDIVNEYTKSIGYRKVQECINYLTKALNPNSNLAKGIAKDMGKGYLNDFKELEKAVQNLVSVWSELDMEVSMNESSNKYYDVDMDIAKKAVKQMTDGIMIIEDMMIRENDKTAVRQFRRDYKPALSTANYWINLEYGMEF